MFIFLEIALISSYALVGFGCGSKDLEASFKYLVINMIATYFIFLGIALLYGRFATLNMAHIVTSIQQYGTDSVVIFAFVLFFVGFGTKAAIVPFHAWVPDAYTGCTCPCFCTSCWGYHKITRNICFNEVDL